jgi:ectoine hydroxylase-related dioxygenase (phytanoyl-CoA dioxygenase family)
MTIVQAVLGAEAVPFRATLFTKTSATNWLIAWHQDTALPLTARFDSPGWGPWARKERIDYCHAPSWALSRIVALRLHLDASEHRNGPLRVVPRSHRYGVLTDEQVRGHVATNPQAECLAPRGGVLAMRPLLIHASSKVQTAAPRRVLHIEYAASLDLAPGIQLAVA